MQEQKKPVEQRKPSPRSKPGLDARETNDTPPPSEPFFESGMREEKPPRSGEEHGGAADAGQERWAQPGVKEGTPHELAKPTGTATGAPSQAPKAPPGPDADEGDGLARFSGGRARPRGPPSARHERWGRAAPSGPPSAQGASRSTNGQKGPAAGV